MGCLHGQLRMAKFCSLGILYIQKQVGHDNICGLKVLMVNLAIRSHSQLIIYLHYQVSNTLVSRYNIPKRRIFFVTKVGRNFSERDGTTPQLLGTVRFLLTRNLLPLPQNTTQNRFEKRKFFWLFSRPMFLCRCCDIFSEVVHSKSAY